MASTPSPRAATNNAPPAISRDPGSPSGLVGRLAATENGEGLGAASDG